MALHALVATHATLQHLADVVRGDARAIVVHRQQQAGATRVRCRQRLRGQQHAAVDPLEGVFQQVAEQLLQVARFAVEARGRVDVELAQHALGGVDLLQAAHDFLGVGFDRQRGGEQLVARRRRARQLVRDQVVHALQLHVQFLAQRAVTGTAVHLRAQHRDRRLQAVRQVGQGVALAFQVLALTLDEGIDAVGQRLQLPRVALAHARGLAALHLGQLGNDPPQRAQAPLQDDGLQQQQDQADATEVEPDPAAEHAQLCTQRARVFHHVDGVREFGGGVGIGIPHQAQAIAVHRALAAVDLDHRQRAFEHFLARRQQATAHGGQHRAFGGHRIALAVRHHHLQVQAAARNVEARIRRLLADVQRAVAGEVDAGRVGGGVVLQALTQVRLRRVGEGGVARVTGPRQERAPAQGRGEPLARRQGARPPASGEPRAGGHRVIARFAVRVQLLAQAADEHFQHVRVAVEVLLVDVLGEVGLGDQFTGMHHQVLQHLVLVAGQVDIAAGDADGLGSQVQGDRAAFQAALRRGTA
ncbi:hypothetical protein G6F68_009872 [Rhizopus microsporus]|nr:hypothetical protein G6F68_009872 [Rhizopus microsporus]